MTFRRPKLSPFKFPVPSLLDRIETLGNRLPHPALLFAVATGLVMVLSCVASSIGWTVEKALPGASTTDGAASILVPINLLNGEGLWWFISHLVPNFVHFPPLGIVIVGMLGIGVAERSGFIPALLTAVAQRVGARALTPTVVFLGISSSVGLDAGYVVLPPIAALLFLLSGRSPLAGIAAAFAGISAGFSANLVITAVDPLLAGFTESAARFVAPDYRVAVTANWWFMAVSTFVLTAVGWLVTALWVEPRTNRIVIQPNSIEQVEPIDRGAMRWALASVVILSCALLALVFIPDAPLYGTGSRFPRWVEATVPILFIAFLIPGVVYGYLSGSFRSNRDVADAMGKTLSALGPYIVLAFFAAQFIEAFKYSQLGEMLAISGGQLLTELAIPVWALLVIFIFVVMFGNLLVGSASAKYAFFAPVFVPMFMYVGISPELTQVAYRVGDSITNIVTPLNPYMVIIVALIQRFVAGAGMGTVVALMLPYAIAFACVWLTMLLIWVWLGVPLGPGGGLHYG
jgi:aminobenzoyl-glutamate transport protein